MTRTKNDKIELLVATSNHLSDTRKMLKAMGKPLSMISKMDDAIVAINHMLQSMESK